MSEKEQGTNLVFFLKKRVEIEVRQEVDNDDQSCVLGEGGGWCVCISESRDQGVKGSRSQDLMKGKRRERED